MTTVTAAGYPAAIRLLHWVTAAIMAAVYVLAFSIEDAASAEQARLILMLHRSAGTLIFLLTIGRLFRRSRSAIPPLPMDLPRWQAFAAHANVMALYVLLLAQPLLGLCASWLHGDHVNLLGLVLPSPLSLDRPLSRQLFALHRIVGFALLGLIVMHMAAALFHHFVRRDDVLRRMVSGGSNT